MSKRSEISLTDAAQRLGISWGRAWRLILTGKLAGEKREGRWFVNELSVAEMESSASASGRRALRGQDDA
jgi:hypothetical protein